MSLQPASENFWKRYWAPMAWCAVLFLLSSIPDFSSPVRLSRWDDKWGHILIYMPLGFFLMRALSDSRPGRQPKLLLIVTTAYGITDEVHQYFVPGRMMDWRDAVADGLGVWLGSLLYFGMRRRFENLSGRKS
jgi:VanZ family protein